MPVNMWKRLARAFLLGQRPNYVIAFVTGRCNFKCRFCCYSAQCARGITADRELSPSQWAALFSGANALIHLTITGGEPFLRKDLDELIILAVRACGAPRISINTNGFLTDSIVSTLKTLLKELDGVEISLAVSLDGPESIHDALRGKDGAFRAARETITEAATLRERHAHFSLRVSSVVCHENADVLEAFLEETASWPIDYHDLGLVRDVLRAEQEAMAAVYGDLTEKQLLRASARYRRKVDWRLQRQIRREVLRSVADPDAVNVCLAGGRLLEVFPDGEIRGCEMGKMWKRSLIHESSQAPIPLVEACALPSARQFRKRAANCTCTFECAHGCNIVFRPGRWWRMLF